MPMISEQEHARGILDRRLTGPLLEAWARVQAKADAATETKTEPRDPIASGEPAVCLGCGTRVGPFLRKGCGKNAQVYCRVCMLFQISFPTLKAQKGEPGHGRVGSGSFLVFDEDGGAAITIPESYPTVRIAAAECRIAPQMPSPAEAVCAAMHSKVPFVYGAIRKSAKYLTGHWHLGDANWMSISGKVEMFRQPIPEGRYSKQSVLDLVERRQRLEVHPNLVEIGRALMEFSALPDDPRRDIADRLLTQPEKVLGKADGKQWKRPPLPAGIYAAHLLNALEARHPGLCALATEWDGGPIALLARAYAQGEESRQPAEDCCDAD